MSTETPKTLTEVGNAPEAEAAPSERRSPATSRKLWIFTYLLVVALIAARVPQVHAYILEEIPSEMLTSIGDPDLERLAVNSAVAIGSFIMALVMALYLSLAAVMERKIFTARVELPGGISFGLFYLIMALCLIPANVVALLTGVVAIREHLWFYAYIFSVGALAPFVFWMTWKGLPWKKIAFLFATSIGMTILTAVG